MLMLIIECMKSVDKTVLGEERRWEIERKYHTHVNRMKEEENMYWNIFTWW